MQAQLNRMEVKFDKLLINLERSVWRVNHLLRISAVQVSLHRLCQFTTCLQNQFLPLWLLIHLVVQISIT